MEGIEQNPIVYDLMSEMAFRHGKVNVQVTTSQQQVILYHKPQVNCDAQSFSGFKMSMNLVTSSCTVVGILQTWIDHYSVRRYGKHDPLIQDAWQILYHTLYNCTDGSYVRLLT